MITAPICQRQMVNIYSHVLTILKWSIAEELIHQTIRNTDNAYVEYMDLHHWQLIIAYLLHISVENW